MDELGKRAFAPPTIPELLVLTVALGAYAVMQQPAATVPPLRVEPPTGLTMDTHGEQGDAVWTGSVPADTNPIGRIDINRTTSATSGTTWYSNQGDKWLDCSLAHETSQCVPRDFPKP